jgi:hypothetical protein
MRLAYVPPHRRRGAQGATTSDSLEGLSIPALREAHQIVSACVCFKKSSEVALGGCPVGGAKVGRDGQIQLEFSWEDGLFISNLLEWFRSYAVHADDHISFSSKLCKQKRASVHQTADEVGGLRSERSAVRQCAEILKRAINLTKKSYACCVSTGIGHDRFIRVVPALDRGEAGKRQRSEASITLGDGAAEAPSASDEGSNSELGLKVWRWVRDAVYSDELSRYSRGEVLEIVASGSIDRWAAVRGHALHRLHRC